MPIGSGADGVVLRCLRISPKGLWFIFEGFNILPIFYSLSDSVCSVLSATQEIIMRTKCLKERVIPIFPWEQFGWWLKFQQMSQSLLIRHDMEHGFPLAVSSWDELCSWLNPFIPLNQCCWQRPPACFYLGLVSIFVPHVWLIFTGCSFCMAARESWELCF